MKTEHIVYLGSGIAQSCVQQRQKQSADRKGPILSEDFPLLGACCPGIAGRHRELTLADVSTPHRAAPSSGVKAAETCVPADSNSNAWYGSNRPID